MQKEAQLKDDVLQLAQGAIRELSGVEVQKIINNIIDPNTHPDKVRELTIKVKFKPHTNRTGITVNAAVSSKLQPNSEVVTQMQIGVDRTTGEIRAKELLPQEAGQLDFDGNESPAPVILKFPQIYN